MIKYAVEMKDEPADELRKIVENYNNDENLSESIHLIRARLEELSHDVSVLRKKKSVEEKRS
jgi:phosphopantothenate synthetase